MLIVVIFGLQIQKSKVEKKMLPASAFQCIGKRIYIIFYSPDHAYVVTSIHKYPARRRRVDTAVPKLREADISS